MKLTIDEFNGLTGELYFSSLLFNDDGFRVLLELDEQTYTLCFSDFPKFFRSYIADRPDRVFKGNFAGQGPDGGRGSVLFYQKGDDIVVTKPDGSFITILKNGVNENPSVIEAMQ